MMKPIPSNETLKGAVSMYFEAMYTCNVELLDKIFHPSSCLFDNDEGSIRVDPISNYRETIRARTSPESQNRSRLDEILLIDNLSEPLHW